MAKKKKHPKHEEEAGEAWLLPYSDLMTLLLAVFIVLFAVSKVDAAKAAQISQEFRDSMMSEKMSSSQVQNQTQKSDKNFKTSGAAISQAEVEKYMGQYELKQLEDLKAEVDSKLKSEGMTTSVTTRIDMRGLVISLNNAVFFESGSAQIKTENEKTLIDVAATINTLDNFIRVEGHTDNVPMHSEAYPSNWELSSARATSVVRLFINNNVPPKKLVAVGYGEYRPVADNSTPEGRTKNRRIDIIVLSEKYNNLEKQLTQ